MKIPKTVEAEMPGFDLSGFAMDILEKDEFID